ncbi:MAG TPA: PP2C family serine/threonine-protein phosphatase [Rhodanobacteraceae bacterium]
MIEHGHATHTGLRREHNEDTYWADVERGLWLVADGMGGPGRGEVASALAIDTLVAACDAGIGLADGFRRAGAAIATRAGQGNPATPMGSTLAALRVRDANRYELAWIGDSRIYLWRAGELLHVPRPTHAEDADAAAPTQRPAPRGLATQALGVTPTLSLDVEPVTGECPPGTQFLLCSDGLSEELDDTHINAIVSRTDLAAQECIDQLVLAALDRGGHDNITALLVRIR